MEVGGGGGTDVMHLHVNQKHDDEGDDDGDDGDDDDDDDDEFEDFKQTFLTCLYHSMA